MLGIVLGHSGEANTTARVALPAAGTQFFFAGGFPTTGFARDPALGTADAGSFSLGSARESENAPLADRCFPTFGLRIASS